MPGLFSRLTWSDVPIRKKLYVPVVIQAALVVLVSLILLSGWRLLAVAREDVSKAAEVMNEMFRLGEDIEGYLANELGWQKLEEDLSRVTSLLDAELDQKILTQLSALEDHLSSYDSSRQVQGDILTEVRNLTSSSRELSNAYIVKVSERLADASERYYVATIERSVIAGALKNTINNYAIEEMFLSLSRGDRTADQAVDLLDSTIANTRADIVLLEGTPFIKKAEAGLALNLRLKELLINYLEALQFSGEKRAQAVHDHAVLMQDIEKLSKDSLLQVLDQVGSGIWILLGVFIATVGISLGSSVLVSLSVTRPLETLRGHIDQLAGSGGDLNFRLKADRKDELGMLAQGVNQFLQTLHGIFTQVASSGHEMADESRRFAEVTSHCSQQMKEQRERTQGVTASAATIKQTIASATEKTDLAARMVEDSEKRVTEVVDSIQSTIKVINIANIELENASSVIGKLNDDSQNIGSILDVIRGIADQTNLLALNAAIEAARAGEQGRGFAVVSDEVRVLAQRTQSSIEEIDKMIRNLQNASMLATSVVASSAENIGGTLATSQAAGEGVKTISESISSIAALNVEIAAMMENQLEKATDINRVVVDIGEVSDANDVAISRASSSAATQVARAEKLVGLMGRFRI